jgi:hypothetical protein
VEERSVFIEKVNDDYKGLVNKYVKEGFVVYSLTITDKCRENPKIKTHLETKKLIDLSQVVFEYVLYRQASFYAHENVDHVYDRYFGSSPSIKGMSKLLELSDIENIYKQKLLLELEKVYTVELKINEIVKRDGIKKAYFFPYDNFTIHLDAASPLIKSAEVLGHKSIKNNLNRFLVFS